MYLVINTNCIRVDLISLLVSCLIIVIFCLHSFWSRTKEYISHFGKYFMDHFVTLYICTRHNYPPMKLGKAQSSSLWHHWFMLKILYACGFFVYIHVRMKIPLNMPCLGIGIEFNIKVFILSGTFVNAFKEFFIKEMYP